jgi:adenylate cyclase
MQVPNPPTPNASFDTTTKVKLVVKISALQGVMLFLAIFISGWFIYTSSRDLTLMNLQNQLQLAANTISISIDGDKYERLQGKASLGTAEYQEIRERLSRFMVNRYLGFADNHVYLFRRISEDSLEFTVMLQDQYVGNRYPMNTKMKEVFAEGHPRYTGIYKDENGTWVSAYSPIFNSQHKVVGLVETDFLDSKFLTSVNDQLTAIITYSLLGVVLAVVISIFLTRLISQPIVQVAKAAIEFSKGDFTQRVDVRTQDEIGTLAKAFNYMVHEIQQKFQLQKYVSQSTLDTVRLSAASGSAGAVQQKVHKVIFFSDIRGFTTFVDRATPEAAVSTVNEYLSLQARIIKASGGDVDKFVGDEVMAVFSGNDAAIRAVQCGIAILSALETLKAEKHYRLDVGIGINSGFVVEGNIGSDDRRDFTVIGDAVNVAARLCSKADGGQILIGDAVYKTLRSTTAKFNLAPQGQMQLKGKPVPLAVYAVS